MKPDWKDAPEWAQWLAMDEDGEWYWFEKEPAKLKRMWAWAGGKVQCAKKPSDWRKSLERRP